ncbi:MAG TPA: phosphodiesterase [Usitatibacter sp.]|nr:phosphodiesterase [Usitatibacter sp.]
MPPAVPIDANEVADLARIASGAGLEAHFQPIARMRERDIFGYEGLIRGPAGTALRSPAALFQAARAAGLGSALELAAARQVVQAFGELRLPGRLALNFSAPNVEHLMRRFERALDFLLHSDVAPSRLVIELTEHERVTDFASLTRQVAELRALGVAIALDDFGDGHSSLRLWAEIAPEFVKIDKYFIRGVQQDAARFQCVKALQQLGAVFGTRLVAEGVEDEADLHVVRDLGIELAQGFLLGKPLAEPPHALSQALVDSLASDTISVYPEPVRMPARQSTVGQLLVQAPPVPPETENNAVVGLFATHPKVHAIPVVAGGRPIGIINRQAFMDRYAQPYYRELYGRRPCTSFMNSEPLCIESNAPMERLTELLSTTDQRYLADGLVVVDGGRYLGLVTGEALVRAVAEIRVEAARYANPLTFLPGNIPISEHIGRLIAGGASFTACYSDLNHFKPFNDQYGYWRGDEMIKLAAGCLARACDPLRDFLGHVGGDDFVVVFQSADWHARCERAVAEFNAGAPTLFDAADRERGGIVAEDRQGRSAFLGLTTLSVGAVRIAPGDYRRPEDVASAAAAAKREAKHRGASVWILAPEAPSC